MSGLFDLAMRLLCVICGHVARRDDPLSNEARCPRCLRSLIYFNGRWWVVADRTY